jgi:hypothetical protein
LSIYGEVFDRGVGALGKRGGDWKDQGFSCDCNDPDACKNAAKGVAAGTIIYWIISEGSRILFPPRNLVPVP